MPVSCNEPTKHTWPSLRIGRSRLALFFCLATSLLPGLSGQSSSAPQQTAATVMLSGAINPRVRREADRGPVEGTKRLSHMALVFSRAPQQRAALDGLLRELQDPSSPNYHKWLTPDEFGERFGASIGILHRVSDWL